MPSTNHPTNPQHELPPHEEQDSLVDRILIWIGDSVLENLSLLIFVTVVLTVFSLLVIGGGSLTYAVSERLNELDSREQDRLVLQEQQHDQVLMLTVEAESKIVQKLDESEWFVVLQDTAEMANSDQLEQYNTDFVENAVSDLKVVFRKQPEFAVRSIVVGDTVWQVNCGDMGFVLNDSYPCAVTGGELIEPNIYDDIAISN
jgi:hypothetical protein